MRRLMVAAAVLLAGCGRHATAADLVAAADRDLARGSALAMRSAADRYRQALALPGDPATQARIHAHLADIEQALELPGVEAELQQAIERATAGGDVEAALIARARLTYETTKGDARIAAMRALVTEARGAGARRAEAIATRFLAYLLIIDRKMSEAITQLDAALELVRLAPDPETEATIERTLAMAYHGLRDPDRAMPHALRSLALARATPMPLLEIKALNVLGGIHQWLHKDPARALIYFTSVVVSYRLLGLEGVNDARWARMTVASVQRALGDHDAALATLGEVVATARADGKQDLELAAILTMGQGYLALGRRAEARQSLTEAAALALKLSNPNQRKAALIGLAQLDLDERRWREAEATTGAVIAFVAAREAEVTDERSRLSYASAMRDAEAMLLEALVGQGDLRRAFAASERMRSRRLLAALGDDEIVDGDGARALVDGDTTMVEYALAASRAYAFIVVPGSLQVVDLGTAAEVQAVARSWSERVAASDEPPEALAAATRALADRVLTPLLPRLQGHRLVIVPDRALHTVAFAALPLPGGAPLIERFELVHVPSASVLRALRGRGAARPRPQRELAILADPIFDAGDPRLGGAQPPPATVVAVRAAGGSADLARLGATHAEAEAIAALLPAGRVYRVEGAAATRAAAVGPEVAGARLVHFATHALLDDVDPDRSGLVMSQVDAAGGAVDGFVRVADIERSHLAAELVVLSACRTALGKSFDGEGLVGLTRAFLRAGVPRVISSLWQVSDSATATLMARFYRGLLVERMSAPAALRRAQLDAAVARGSALRLWASFAFYGDWR